MKTTPVVLTSSYDFNVNGGAVGAIPLLLNDSVGFKSPGGSNMVLVIQLASVVVFGAMGGNIATTLSLDLGGVPLFAAMNPNNMLLGQVLTTPTDFVIPNNSDLVLNVGVFPVTQGDFKLVAVGYIIYI